MITGYPLSPDAVALEYPPSQSLPLLSFLKAQQECKAKTEAFEPRVKALEDYDYLEPRFCLCCWEKEKADFLKALDDLETSRQAAYQWSRAFSESEIIHNQDAPFPALDAGRRGIVHSIQEEVFKAFKLYNAFRERIATLAKLLNDERKEKESPPAPDTSVQA